MAVDCQEWRSLVAISHHHGPHSRKSPHSMRAQRCCCIRCGGGWSIDSCISALCQGSLTDSRHLPPCAGTRRLAETPCIVEHSGNGTSGCPPSKKSVLCLGSEILWYHLLFPLEHSAEFLRPRRMEPPWSYTPVLPWSSWRHTHVCSFLLSLWLPCWCCSMNVICYQCHVGTLYSHVCSGTVNGKNTSKES